MNSLLSNHECAQIFRVMSDPTRLLMIKSLFQGEKCGTELASELDLPQPQVAHHLGILKNALLLVARRDGQRVYYTLDPVVQDSIRQNNEMAINLGCCKISFPANQPK